MNFLHHLCLIFFFFLLLEFCSFRDSPLFSDLRAFFVGYSMDSGIILSFSILIQFWRISLNTYHKKKHWLLWEKFYNLERLRHWLLVLNCKKQRLLGFWKWNINKFNYLAHNPSLIYSPCMIMLIISLQFSTSSISNSFAFVQFVVLK